MGECVNYTDETRALALTLALTPGVQRPIQAFRTPDRPDGIVAEHVRFYLTGHSLGGGLAKLVALEVGQKSAAWPQEGWPLGAGTPRSSML